jgi:hypothetical protein
MNQPPPSYYDQQGHSGPEGYPAPRGYYPQPAPFAEPGPDPRWTPPGPADAGEPPTHLALSIIAMLFFWPTAAYAISRAAVVERLWRYGLFDEAWAASRSARRWSVASLLVAVCWLILFGVGFAVLTVVAQHATGGVDRGTV